MVGADYIGGDADYNIVCATYDDAECALLLPNNGINVFNRALWFFDHCAGVVWCYRGVKATAGKSLNVVVAAALAVLVLIGISNTVRETNPYFAGLGVLSGDENTAILTYLGYMLLILVGVSGMVLCWCRAKGKHGFGVQLYYYALMLSCAVMVWDLFNSLMEAAGEQTYFIISIHQGTLEFVINMLVMITLVILFYVNGRSTVSTVIAAAKT